MNSEADSGSSKRRRVQSATVIDPCMKSQCWVLLKRLLIHPDGAAFKKPISPEVLDLETIQSMLLKGLYFRTREFADDIRATFSHAMASNPPRHELHKKARELSRVFESNWESLQEKWAAQKGESKKTSKVPDFSQQKKTQKEKNGGFSDSQHFVDSSKTDPSKEFVEKCKHDGFRDSQHFDDTTKSQFRQEKQRRGSKTDSTDGSVRTSSGDYLRSKFQGQAHSTHSATVEEKWAAAEKGEGMKSSEATVFSQEKKTQKAKNEGCGDSQHYDDSSKTYSNNRYVKRQLHDSFRNSQRFDDATKSQFREKKQRSYLRLRGYKTDSNDGCISPPSGDYLRSKFHGQARSTHSASQRVFTMEEKWAAENGEGKKISEFPLFSKEEKTQKAKNSYSHHIDDSHKTDFTNGFVKKRKHDSFRDSQQFDEATKSQYRQEKHRSYLRFRGSKTDSTDGSVSTPPSSDDYLHSKFRGPAHSAHSSSQHVIMVISDSKLEAKEAQKSLLNFCEAASEKKQEEDEDKSRIRASEIKKEREASRRRLQEMERSVDIEDNLQTYREFYSLCGFTLKYHTLKGFGLKLKPDWG